jgi:hypothetical protein
MSYGLVGLYALYFIFVGVNGNASPMASAMEQDAKGFAPWLLAILILKALSTSDTIAPMIKPFIALALVTFTVKNYDAIVTQVDQITGLNLPTSTKGA